MTCSSSKVSVALKPPKHALCLKNSNKKTFVFFQLLNYWVECWRGTKWKSMMTIIALGSWTSKSKEDAPEFGLWETVYDALHWYLMLYFSSSLKINKFNSATKNFSNWLIGPRSDNPNHSNHLNIFIDQILSQIKIYNSNPSDWLHKKYLKTMFKKKKIK